MSNNDNNPENPKLSVTAGNYIERDVTGGNVAGENIVIHKQEIHHHHVNESKNDIPPPDLTRLPKPATNQFIGRKTELTKLNAAFNNRAETGIVAIIADGGIGKSALTDKWISDLKKSNYDSIQRVFAWSFYSQGSHQHTFTSSQEFFAKALPFFGFDKELPKNDDDKARELAKCLQNQAGLLLLDGLEPLQQPPHIGGDMADVGMREFLLCLHHHRHPQTFVLISSRQDIVELDERDDYLALRLESLTRPSATRLLESFKLTGTRREFIEVACDLHGHALSLVLLANLLKLHKRGDIRYAKELPPLDSDSKHNGHAKRVLSYYNALLSDNERRFMHCLALFDRPMDWREKAALFKNAELAAPLAALSDEDWQDLQTGLEIKGLLLGRDAINRVSTGDDINHHRTQWDTHPLIRQFFAQQFNTQQPQAFQQAHRVLFEYFQSVPDKQQPDTLAELEPLYRAVVHGCLAGEYQTTLNEVYIKRILRRNSSGWIEYYSLYNLSLCT